MNFQKLSVVSAQMLAVALWAGLCFGQEPEGVSKNEKAEEFAKQYEAFSKWCVEELSEPRVKLEKQILEERIEEIQELSKLTDDQILALRAAGSKAIEESQSAWEKGAVEFIETLWKWEPILTVESIERSRKAMEKIGDSRKTRWAGRVGFPLNQRPEALDVWIEALDETLNADHLTAWRGRLNAEKKRRVVMVESAVEQYQSKRRDVVELRLAREIVWMGDLISLDEKREDFLKKLVEKTIEGQLKIVAELCRIEANLLSADRVALLSEGRKLLTVEVPKNLVSSDVWQNGLAEFLSKAEMEILAAERKRIAEANRKEIAELTHEALQNGFTDVGVVGKKKLDREIKNIVATLSLDSDKKKKLEDLGVKSLDAYEKDWAKAMREVLSTFPRKQRKQVVTEGYLSLSGREDIKPLNQSVWQEGLKAVVGENELARLELVRAERNERRVTGIGNLLLKVMDDVIDLTESQRDELLPIVTKIGDEKHLKKNRGKVKSLSPSTLSSLFQVSEKKDAITPLLLPEQKKRWLAWIGEKSNRKEDIGFSLKSNDAKEAESVEAFRERAVASLLFVLMEKKRVEYVNFHLAKVDAIDRLVKLDDKQRRYLETAAKGDAQEEVDVAIEPVADSIRRSFQTLQRKKISQLLSQLSKTRIGKKIPSQDKLVASMVQKILNPEQLRIYNDYLAKQKKFGDEAILLYVLSNAELSLQLSSEQIELLKPRFSGSMKKYEAEISQNSAQWYLKSKKSMMLFSFFSENELNQILTKQQAEKWTTAYKPQLSESWAEIEEGFKERAGK